MKWSISILLALILGIGLYLAADQPALAEQPNAAVSGKIVKLGKQIFFDANLSVPKGQSCATCHDPAAGFANPDQKAVSDGAGPGRVGNRNPQSISYAMYTPRMYFDPTTTPAIPEGQYKGGFFWDGRADTLEIQAGQPFLNPLEMNNPNKRSVVKAIRQGQYAGLFKEVFGPAAFDNEEQAFGYVSQALAAYMRSPEVSPFTSKYDYWKKGEAQLTDSELRGYQLFTGKERGRCFNCHTEGLFTNFGHQNLGTPKNPSLPYYSLPPELNPDGEKYIDKGIGDYLRTIGLSEAQALREDGKFKIPSLRNVALTAPYSHNGVHKTIRDVVVFNNTRDLPEAGWPEPEVGSTVHRHPMVMPGTLGRLGLTDQEINDIVAFLYTLTDGYVPGTPQPVAPTDPSSLKASLRSAGKVALSWKDTATDETSFRIERSVNGGVFTFFKTISANPSTGTVSANDGTVTAGNTYTYRVAAVKDWTPSAYSATVSVTVGPPTAPSGLMADAERIVGMPKDNITLNWTDNSDNETGFRIMRATDEAFTKNVVTIDVPKVDKTTRIDTAARKTTYYYKVRAVNGAGKSDWSNTVSVVTP